MKNTRKTLLALVAVAITAGTLWYTHRTVIPKKATLDDVQTEAKQGGYRLINTQDLWQRYQTKPERPVLVDTRQEWEYRAGHMKGAVNFPMEPTRWFRWRNRGALKKFLGPDKQKHIVFY